VASCDRISIQVWITEVEIDICANLLSQEIGAVLSERAETLFAVQAAHESNRAFRDIRRYNRIDRSVLEASKHLHHVRADEPGEPVRAAKA
jgi:hypothetical protein